MTKSNAEQIRDLISLLESNKSESLEEALPIFTQKLKSKLTGLGAKFSHRLAGVDQVQKALVPYLKMFTTYMGRKGQNWTTVTWRTLGNFVTSSASLKLPMGELTPTFLNKAEFLALLKDPNARAVINKYADGKVNEVLPKDLTAQYLDLPVIKSGVKPTKKADVAPAPAPAKAGGTVTEALWASEKDKAQSLITGVLVAVIIKLFDKADETGEFDTTPDTKSPKKPGSAAEPPPSIPPSADLPGLLADIKKKLTPDDYQDVIGNLRKMGVNVGP